MNVFAVPAKILGVILIILLVAVAGFFLVMTLLSVTRRKKDPEREQRHMTPEDAKQLEEAEKESRTESVQ